MSPLNRADYDTEKEDTTMSLKSPTAFEGLEDEAQFARRVHELIVYLKCSGLGLVIADPNEGPESGDICDRLKDAVGHFGRIEGMSSGSIRLLNNYLADYLYDVRPDGCIHVQVDGQTFSQVKEPEKSGI